MNRYLSFSSTALRPVTLSLMAALLVGCSSSGNLAPVVGKESQMGANSTSSGSRSSRDSNRGRYSISQDHGPSGRVDLDHVRNAVPRAEPKSRGGNKSPYRVLGKTYYVMPSAVGYKQRGTASWYGKKFHGHQTSNGEIYDMYSMSAAHKALPLPTYLRVTNLDNGRQVIVRVNDRGPFHGNRLIDLSYAAAYKLDMLKKGTARVELEAITPGRGGSAYTPAARPSAQLARPQIAVPAGQYLQLGAFSTRQAAVNVQQDVRSILPSLAIRVVPIRVGGKTLYRVKAGPLSRNHPVQSSVDLLGRAGYHGVRLVEQK